MWLGSPRCRERRVRITDYNGARSTKRDPLECVDVRARKRKRERKCRKHAQLHDDEEAHTHLESRGAKGARAREL